MRYHDLGAFYAVTVSRREVEEFARRWPCFGHCRSLRFEFARRNGDLVDVTGDAGMDSSGVCALADDAKAYAETKANTTRHTNNGG